MRMYLSSFRLGDAVPELLRLVGEGRRTAVVANAADVHGDGPREQLILDEFEMLGGIGLEPEEVDLRRHFGADDGAVMLADRLRECALVWVRGGNAFVLRRAAAASGFDRALVALLAEDVLVYGGYSAGVCMLSPTLAGIELCDDPEALPSGYEGMPRVDAGLGLIPFSVVPHYRTPGHPETGLMEAVVAHHLDHRLPFVVLRDGDVIVGDGGSLDVVRGNAR